MFFTSAASGDLRPSFFEMYAQDKLVLSLRPAVRFLLDVLAVRQPFFFKLIPHSSEVFLGLHLAMEANSLFRSNALIAEAFYSLRRDDDSSGFAAQEASVPLRKNQIFASIVCTVFIPYLKTKLDDIYEKNSGGSATRLLGSLGAGETDVTREQSSLNVGKTLKSLFMRFYPFISSGYDLLHLMYNMLFLFEKTDYFTPLLHVQKMVVRRLTIREMQSAMMGSTSENSRLSTFLDRFMTGLKYGLIIGVFAFKALEYYYRVEGQNNKQSTLLLRPPVALPPASVPDASVPKSKANCPICRQKRTNPAACTVSGYVFCYRCIFEFVEERKRCPITLVPASTADIRRIYESS